MKLHNNFKIFWWIFLLLSLLFLIYKRLKYIVSDNIKPFDYLIITIFIVLALLPFFSEMSMFGFKLKKEIDEVKDKVENGIQEIKSVINQISNNNHIYFNSPNFNDDQLKELKEKLIQNTGSTVSPSNQNTKLEYEIPDELKKLFTIRYAIEKELKRLAVNYIDNPNRRIFIRIGELLTALRENNVINPSFANAIREIYTITSKAIHAEDITPKELDFALTVSPAIINELKNL